MQSFIVGILIKVLTDPKIQPLLLQVVDRLAEFLLPKLAAVIPAAFAAGVKLLEEHLPDVHLPGLPQVTEAIRSGINALLPEDIDIPILSDAFEKATGIDLTDILTGRHP